MDDAPFSLSRGIEPGPYGHHLVPISAGSDRKYNTLNYDTQSFGISCTLFRPVRSKEDLAELEGDLNEPECRCDLTQGSQSWKCLPRPYPFYQLGHTMSEALAFRATFEKALFLGAKMTDESNHCWVNLGLVKKGGEFCRTVFPTQTLESLDAGVHTYFKPDPHFGKYGRTPDKIPTPQPHFAIPVVRGDGKDEVHAFIFKQERYRVVCSLHSHSPPGSGSYKESKSSPENPNCVCGILREAEAVIRYCEPSPEPYFEYAHGVKDESIFNSIYKTAISLQSKMTDTMNRCWLIMTSTDCRTVYSPSTLQSIGGPDIFSPKSGK